MPSKTDRMTVEPAGDTFTCRDCRKTLPTRKNGGTGYGIFGNDKVCYECCGTRDKQSMDSLKVGEKFTLYLSRTATGRHEVTNWPGTLRYDAFAIVNTRRSTTFSFRDHRGCYWTGIVRDPDNSQIATVKRVDYGANPVF